MEHSLRLFSLTGSIHGLLARHLGPSVLIVWDISSCSSRFIFWFCISDNLLPDGDIGSISTAASGSSNTLLQVLITSYTRGEEDSTHLALTDMGREVVDTLTVTQFFFHLPHIGRKVVEMKKKVERGIKMNMKIRIRMKI